MGGKPTANSNSTSSDKDKDKDAPQRITFTQFFAQCDRLRTYLAQELGVKRGDHVAVLMSNVPEFCVAVVAIVQLGGVACCLNAFWESKELDFGVRDCGASVLIADDKRASRLLMGGRLDALLRESVLRKLIVVRPSGELALKKEVVPYETVVPAPLTLADNKEKNIAVVPVALDLSPDSDCVMIYTSGTTSGRPKGVVLTHRSFTQTMMCYELFSTLLRKLRGGKPSDRRVDLVTSPLFHSASLSAVFFLSFKPGHKLVLMPRWEADAALNVCLAEGVTFLGCMPTMLSDVLKSPVFSANRTKFKFTNIGTGGAATPGDLIRRTAQILPHISQGSGWGMSECNSIGTVIGGPEYLEFPNSCGKPHAIVELKLINPETLEDVPPGTNAVGELCIKSVTNMRELWRLPEDTKKAFLPGGWLRSGDLARIDPVDGFVFIVDRVKNIVIRGGENISVVEVEDVVYQLPGQRVAEAAAFGLPDERLGERLCVAVVPVPLPDVPPITEQEVVEHCAASLAKFKVPSQVFVRKASQPLPRNATGKILHRALKEEYKLASSGGVGQGKVVDVV